MAEKQEWEKVNDELLRQLKNVSETLDRINGDLKSFNVKAQETIDKLRAK